MRWLFRLSIVLIICLVTIGLPAVPAQANSTYIQVSPSSEVPGTEVTVRGYNFTAPAGLDIYFYLETTNTTDRKRVAEVEETLDEEDFVAVFEVPESPKGIHRVRAEVNATVYFEDQFEVTPRLTVTPTEGSVNTTVTVRGMGFGKNETNIELRYYLNSTYFAPILGNITANATGSWQRSLQIPSSAQGSRRIDAKGDTSQPSDVTDATFKVTPVISLVKLSGSPGENITMTGSGFAAGDRDIRILFAGQPVRREIKPDGTGYWQADFQVPQLPRGTYNVSAYGELTPQTTVTPRSFEIRPGVILSPAAGHVGMDLTVTGGAFAPDRTVIIWYGDSPQATVSTNGSGSFTVIFPVPESQHGEHEVAAEDDAGDNVTATFIMESDPPATPELSSPADGSRLGFMWNVRPTFNWSAVADESGVRYNLQIATSANITAGGFADPVVSITGIVGTNYTLNRTEALSRGTYYWIVRAVDRAGNAGNWTLAYSLHAGGLPLWAFILIIVAAVAIIGTLVYFLIIRKRTYYY